jgi:hypothetical protein
MILIGANPLLGPLERVGPSNGFDRIKIFTSLQPFFSRLNAKSGFCDI